MRKPTYSLLLAGALCASGWLAAAAQDTTLHPPQEPSPAEAARKARAQKKSEPQAKQVWDDDNIPKEPREVPAETKEGGQAATGEAGGTPAQPAATGSPDDQAKKAALEADWRSKFAGARKKLDDDQKDLDLMQREYNLKRQQYYSDPNTALRQQYNNNVGGRGPELADLEKKIEETKQKIEADKQAISDLEDQLRRDGLPPGWSRP
jgi:hypothetical protein